MDEDVTRSLSLYGTMPATLKGNFTVRLILIFLSDTSRIGNFASLSSLKAASLSPVTAISQDLGCVSMYANYLSDGLCPYDFCPCHKIGSNAF